MHQADSKVPDGHVWIKAVNILLTGPSHTSPAQMTTILQNKNVQGRERFRPFCNHSQRLQQQVIKTFCNDQRLCTTDSGKFIVSLSDSSATFYSWKDKPLTTFVKCFPTLRLSQKLSIHTAIAMMASACVKLQINSVPQIIVVDLVSSIYITAGLKFPIIVTIMYSGKSVLRAYCFIRLRMASLKAQMI